MFPRSARARFEAGLCVLAAALGVAGALGPWHEALRNALLFGTWCAALLLAFLLGARLPLRSRSQAARVAGPAAVAVAAVGFVVLANTALYRHDVHVDLTRQARFTAPAELETIAASLKTGVVLTYFYNAGDDNARTASDVLTDVARRHPHLRLRAVDLDKDPRSARAYEVRAYNTAVIEAEGRRIQAENTVDLRQIAFAVQRALKQKTETVCFMTGHGEPYETTAAHVHFSHVETLQGHDVPGAGDVIEAPPEGLDRLKLAIEAIGYADRAFAPAAAEAVPDDCAVVADIGPRRAYAPAEAGVLDDYLGRGGRLLLMYDLEFPIEARLAALLARVGLSVGARVVADPTNHYGTDEKKVAVPYYPPHPITERIAMTVFPGARPIRIGGPVDGVAASALFASSRDSYLRPVEEGPGEAAPGPSGPQTLAVALQGSWPGGAPGGKPFRLVLVGNASFADNAFFPYVSNGDLAVSMIRWLAADTETPTLKPASYSLPEVILTRREMQGVFLVDEVLLPLGIVLAGALVWWRRR